MNRLPDERPGEAEVSERLARTLAHVDAPDVVLAVTRRGRRTTATGGTARTAVRRAELRYPIGSLTKTFTVLLLADLAAAGALALDDPLTAHLPRSVRAGHPHARRITLRHLATHTSGLPRIPRDLVPGALLRPYANGYAGYDTGRLLHAFARTRPRHAPGTHWRYSNFGLALLGSALAHTAGTDYGTLLAQRVLRPLQLDGTGTAPAGDGREATGHRADGRTPLPPFEAAAFAPAAAVRTTPADLLRYLEAHLLPDNEPQAAALRQVQAPQLRRGAGHRQIHTLTWYRHPAPGGPLLFHAGAVFGHQSFAGFHPASGTGVAALATRQGRACRLVESGYALLYGLCAAAGGQGDTRSP